MRHFEFHGLFLWQAFAHGAKAVASDKTSGITKLSDDGCSIEEVPRPGSHATSYLPLLAPLLPPTATLAATARWLSPAAAQCTPRPPRARARMPAMFHGAASPPSSHPPSAARRLTASGRARPGCAVQSEIMSDGWFRGGDAYLRWFFRTSTPNW